MDFSADLIRLMPKKFRTIEMLQDFLSSCGEILDEIHADISGVATFKVPETCPADYLHYVADLLGYQLSRVYDVGSADETQRRREFLRTLVPFLKAKGLLTTPKYIAYFLYSFTDVAVYELWTDDYLEFRAAPEEGDYLTPHYLILLPDNIYALLGDTVYEGKLVIDSFIASVQTVQPAHTVLHYDLNTNSDYWRVGPAWDQAGPGNPSPYDDFSYRWRVDGDSGTAVAVPDKYVIRIGGYHWI